MLIKKKHTKDLSYGKPYYKTILPFIRKGVHFLTSFLLLSFSCARIFQTWDSLLCFEFTRKLGTIITHDTDKSTQYCPPASTVQRREKKRILFFSKNHKYS